MSIPSNHKNRYIYHFTHIDNLPGLLKTGFLANKHPDFPGNRLSIAEPDIQNRRANMPVSCEPGGVVHDYVPLYFGSISPMLLGVINKKNIDQFEMLYFEFPISLLCRDNVIFTDASANTNSPPNFYSNPADLDKLNWEEIDTRKWKSKNETLRHQRMAEVLVHSQLSLQDASRVVVWNDGIKQQVLQIVQDANISFPQKIEFESRYRYHWFKDFAVGCGRKSVVMGPREIQWNYQNACEQTNDDKGQAANAPYKTPTELLNALRIDFGCISHTAELVGLKSENGIHKLTVDAHTIEVVNKLKTLPEFIKLLPKYQHRIELAAYLHDIGKGPKSRWASNNGLQKVDPNHPVHAMPMMVEILTQDVEEIEQEDANLILKLVCYHDLVGEVLGKGRDEQQIIDVTTNELELDMLFVIGKADATSLCESWWDENKATALYDRCLKAINSKQH